MNDKAKTLASEYPDVAAQWHPTLNGDVTPDDVRPRSTKVFWWWCEKGQHAYQQKVSQKTRGRGCPVCANRSVLVGRNDLASQYPEIAAQWHPTLNGNITPEQVTYATTKKFWWICDKGHAYEAEVAKRTLRGHGCHYCSGQSPIKGETDLESQNPEIAKLFLKEYNAISPDEIAKKSNKICWWKCNHGYDHPYQRSVYNQVLAGGECPYCSNKRVLPGFNDLQSSFPELMGEWDYERNDIKPYEILAHSSHKVHWKCSEGHTWIATPSQRTAKERINVCPECQKLRTSFTEQCVIFYVKKHYCGIVKESAKIVDGRNYEVDIWLPEKKLAIEYNGAFYHKDKLDSDIEKFVLLAEQGIEVVYILEPKGLIIPDTRFYMMKKFNMSNLEESIKWVLQDVVGISEHEVDIDISRDQLDILHNYRTEHIAHQFLYYHPSLSAFWDYEKNNPNRIYPYLFDCGSDVSAQWRCPACRHEWASTIKHMTSHEQCPSCGIEPCRICETKSPNVEEHHQINANEYLLMTRYPRIAREFDIRKNAPMTLDRVSSLSKDRLYWRCPQGHIWEASPFERSYNHVECPYCQGKKEYNALDYNRPDIAKYWHPTKNGDLLPEDITCGSGKEVWWTCDAGHSFKTSPNVRCLDGYSCPVCSGQQADSEYNSLGKLRPDIAKLWHPTKNGNMTPDNVTCGSNRLIWWKGDCGHEYQKTPAQMCKTEKKHCPYCNNQKLLVGFNDLETRFPEIAQQWDCEKNNGVFPNEVPYFSSVLAYWKCDVCGYEWQTTVHGRTSRNSGCLKCTASPRRVTAIKKSRQNQRPSYIEYFENHLDEMESCIDEEVADIILKAMQTDIQVLTYMRLHYQKSFDELAAEMEVSEELLSKLYRILGLPELNEATLAAHRTLLDNCRRLEDKGCSPEWLIDQRILERRTAREIADEIDVNKYQIDKLNETLGIGKRRAKTTQQLFGHGRKWFWEQNVVEQKSYTQISKELGVDNAIVERLYKDLDIPYMGACRDDL